MSQKTDLSSVPAELRSRPQWVLWKSLIQQDDKPRKVPVSISGVAAKSNDPATWTTFDEAVGAIGKWSTCGVGYVFDESDPYCGIDLDNALQAGEWLPWAAEILERFRDHAYGEISPSGQGVKLITIARKPDGARSSKKWNDGEGLECYDRVRFWTMTGQVVEGFQTIGEGQEAVNWIIGKYLSPPKGTTPTPRPAEASGNGEDLLWRATRYIETADLPPEGERNITAFRLAGNVFALEGDHGKRLSEDQLIAFMRQWNGRNEKPLPDDELVAVTRNGMRNGTPPAPKRSTQSTGAGTNGRGAATIGMPVPAFNLCLPECQTETAAARRVAGEYSGRIRWCDSWGKWLIWDGKRWHIDDELRIERAVKRVASSIMTEAKDLVTAAAGDKALEAVARKAMSYARSINSHFGVRNVAALTRSEPGVPIQPNHLDVDPWALNCENGTLDLRTGKIRAHRREDLITKLAPVEYSEDASCPTWREFLREVFQGDQEVIDFIRRAAGYSLTGATTERCLFFLHGKGKNGKTTLVSTLQNMLGEYASPMTTEFLMASKGQAHPTEITDLAGCRMAVTVETEDHRRLAESFVKQITGGEDVLKGRRMREDFWSFRATHKLWLSGNHKPRIRGTDDGIWDRIRLVPFGVRFTEPDTKLPVKLEAEWPGILAWAVAGCLEWRSDGLGEPTSVREATASYRREMDVVSQFLEDCTEEVAGGVAYATPLYRAYVEWCKSSGEHPIQQRAFGAQLTERFGDSRPGTRNRKCYDGLTLTTETMFE